MEGYGFEDDIELDIDLGKVIQNFLGKCIPEGFFNIEITYLV